MKFVYRLSGGLVLGAMALGGCGSNDDRSAEPPVSMPSLATRPERSVEGKPVHHYESLAEQAQGSDFVVRGRVVQVEPGRVAGELPEEKIYFRNVTIEVLEKAKGPVDPKTLVYEEEGWDADGTGYVMNGIKWSEVGDEAWYFLAERDDGITRLASQYGRYTLSGSEPGASGLKPETDGPWRMFGAKSATPAQVRDAVLAAIKEQS